MSPMNVALTLADGVLQGSPQAAARLISLLESRSDDAVPALIRARKRSSMISMISRRRRAWRRAIKSPCSIRDARCRSRAWRISSTPLPSEATARRTAGRHAPRSGAKPSIISISAAALSASPGRPC